VRQVLSSTHELSVPREQHSNHGAAARGEKRADGSIRCPATGRAGRTPLVVSSAFFLFLLHKHWINKTKIFLRRCKLRSKFSICFFASQPSGDLEPTQGGAGTREEPGTLTQRGALFSLVPLLWERVQFIEKVTPRAPGVCLLLQYLLQSCSRGRGGGAVEDMCYKRLRAEACVD
jgi:hypothetical protein